MREALAAAAAIRPRTAHGLPLFELCDYERCILPGVCGNKARKFASLCARPRLPALVSHGGPQSNAMLALAALAAARGAELTYHTKPLPGWLRTAPTGSLAEARRLGMRLVEHPSAAGYEAAVRACRAAGGGGFVPQGGACPDAEAGVAELASEIDAWWAGQSDTGRSESTPTALRVVVPAGTGTTALFLARHLSASAGVQGARVFAVPCVGDAAYLREQMADLDAASGGCAAYAWPE